MSNNITSFSGQYRFLSNFWPVTVHLDGVQYPTVEHAYQAAKTLDPAQRDTVLESATPGRAKRAGRAVTKRADWDAVKVDVMRHLLVEKFRDPALRRALVKTDPRNLIEGNTWGDVFWGQCNGVGKNTLGRLLMEIRREVIEGEA